MSGHSKIGAGGGLKGLSTHFFFPAKISSVMHRYSMRRCLEICRFPSVLSSYQASKIFQCYQRIPSRRGQCYTKTNIALSPLLDRVGHLRWNPVLLFSTLFHSILNPKHVSFFFRAQHQILCVPLQSLACLIKVFIFSETNYVFYYFTIVLHKLFNPIKNCLT